MSKLRNRIDDIVALAYYEGSDSRPLLPDWTDRILALIADAMLSNGVVDAGERVLIRDEWAKANRAKSFNVIETALQAAGITQKGTSE